MRKLFSHLLLLMFIATLSACGGASQSPAAKRTYKAVIKSTALTASLYIATVNLAITVPLGVFPTTKGAVVEVINSADHVVQNVSLNDFIYTPATSVAVPGQITFGIVQADGFKENDEITVHLEVADGAIPVESDFQLLPSYEFRNILGNLVTGLNPVLTATIQ
jgi:hypothetical protein